MTIIANVFTKLQTSINVLRQISKEYRFRVPLDKKHGTLAKTLLKSERRHVYHIY